MANDDKYDEDDYDNLSDLEAWLDERLEEHDFDYQEICHTGDDIDDYDRFPYIERRKSNISNGESDKEEGFYESLMKLYVKDLESLVKNIKPSTYQVISGSGPAWFYEPTTRKLIKTERGSEIVIVPGEADEQDRMLVRTMNTFIMIPREEILDVGYN